MASDEGWQPIPGFPDYSVNPLGQVMHNSNQRLLRVRYNEYNVAYVGLMRNWEQKNKSLARLVAQTFLAQPTEIFDTPIQLDGDPSNCAVDNLMWRPRWYAVRYKQQFRERYDRPIKRPVRAINEGERFRNSFEAAIRYGLLEKEVVASVVNRTPAVPTYQRFELVTMR